MSVLYRNGYVSYRPDWGMRIIYNFPPKKLLINIIHPDFTLYKEVVFYEIKIKNHVKLETTFNKPLKYSWYIYVYYILFYSSSQDSIYKQSPPAHHKPFI